MRTEDLVIVFICCLFSSLCSATLTIGIFLTATTHKHNAWPALIVVSAIPLLLMFFFWIISVSVSTQQNRPSNSSR